MPDMLIIQWVNQYLSLFNSSY